MVVLVLDPRWPEMIPAQIINQIRGPVTYTEDVPAHGRTLQSTDTAGEPWLITTDESAAPADAEIIRVPSLEDPVYQATRVMHAARTRGEWEQAMTHTSLLPYLREEAAELAEAIEQQASEEELLKELADVLLQVLFHSEIASERGAFSFPDVAGAFVSKMRSRAPYIFDGSSGPVDIETQDRLWAEGKAREKR